MVVLFVFPPHGPLLLWRALTGVLRIAEADELDLGTRRSGPTEAERDEVLFTGWKIAPERIKFKIYFKNQNSQKGEMKMTHPNWDE